MPGRSTLQGVLHVPRGGVLQAEHLGELFSKIGFIVTNLPMESDWVVRFYNQRGTAGQYIKCTADVALAMGWSPVQRLVSATKPSHQEAIPANSNTHPALAGSFNPLKDDTV